LRRKALDIIMSHYSKKGFEYPEEMLEKTLVIKVQIDSMSGKQA